MCKFLLSLTSKKSVISYSSVILGVSRCQELLEFLHLYLVIPNFCLSLQPGTEESNM